MDESNEDVGRRQQVLAPSGTYAATKAAIDVQIATARAWPRNLKSVGEFLARAVSTDEETALSCIYSLPRAGSVIRGPSIRLAEILTMAWGHMRVWARIVDEGHDFVVVAGGAHDLQTNNVFEQEVVRRIVDNRGKRYSHDMIQQTVNAAASIAQRNSILKVIPEFVWRPAEKACTDKIVGDVKTLNERRIKAIGQFAMFGVLPARIFKKLNVAGINDISGDHLINLIGIFNAIREQQTTVEEQFGADEITSRSLAGGSPLAAAADDGDPVAEESTASPAAAATASAPASEAKPAQTAAPSDGAAAAKPAKERKPRAPRQDADSDLPARQPAGEPAHAAPTQAAPQPAAAPASPEQGSTPAAHPPAAGTFEAHVRDYRVDCLAARDEDSLKRVTMRYGEMGVFEEISDAQREVLGEIYRAAKEALRREEAEGARKAATERQDAAKNDAAMAAANDSAGSVDDVQAVYDDGPDRTVGEATDEPKQAKPAEQQAPPPPRNTADDVPWDKFNDVRPETKADEMLWVEIVADMWKGRTYEDVLARYDANAPKIARLSEMAATNMRTIRFRMRKLKPEN